MNYTTIYYYLKKYKLYISIIFLFSLLSLILTSIQPLLLSKLIDFLSKKSINNLIKLIKFIVFLNLINFVLGFIMKFTQLNFRIKIEREIKNKIFKHIINLDLLKLNKSKTGEFLSKIEQDSMTFSSIFLNAISIIINILQIPILLVILFNLNFQLTFIIICIICINSLMFFMFSKKIKDLEIHLRLENDKNLSFIQEMLNSYKFITSFFIQEKICRLYNKNLNSLYNCIKNKNIENIKFSMILQILNIIQYLTIIILSSYNIINGKFEVGILIAFNSYSIMLDSSVKSIFGINLQLQEMIVSINRIQNYLVESENCNPNLKENLNLYGDIEINNLSFSFEGTSILSNKSFKIPKNGITIVKGKSGIGKSTFLDLLINNIKSYTGEIIFNGNNLKFLNECDIKNQICLVSQEQYMFSMSIKDNLKILNENISDDKIVDICKSVNIHNFIDSLPMKYDTLLGDDGILLSGGQKQKISLARILASDYNVILLDEITSAIDNKDELDIMNLLVKISNSKKIILVSHRENTYDYADQIIDFDLLKQYG